MAELSYERDIPEDKGMPPKQGSPAVSALRRFVDERNARAVENLKKLRDVFTGSSEPKANANPRAGVTSGKVPTAEAQRTNRPTPAPKSSSPPATATAAPASGSSATMTTTLDRQRRADAAKADAQSRPRTAPTKSTAAKGQSANPRATVKSGKVPLDVAQRTNRPKQTVRPAATATAAAAATKSSNAAGVGSSGPSTRGGNRKPAKAATPAPKSARPAKSATAKTARRGSAGAASNRDLPGRTTIKYADSKKGSSAGGPRKIHPDGKARFYQGTRKPTGPGGGADSVLAASRGKSRWRVREK